MTFQSIKEHMAAPWDMQIKEIVESYMYLVSVHAQKTEEFLEAENKAALFEIALLAKGLTSASAKTHLKASEEGKRAALLRGELMAIQEMVRALKRAQQYHSDAAHNRV